MNLYADVASGGNTNPTCCGFSSKHFRTVAAQLIAAQSFESRVWHYALLSRLKK
jgi:hypothetical protein